MLQFSDLSIRDREIFNKYLKAERYEGSEMNFTNFFMWKDVYNFRYTEFMDHLLIIAVPNVGEPYAMLPAGHGEEDKMEAVLHELMEYFKSKGWKFKFKRVEENKLELFKSLKAFDFEYEEDRDNSDYLYAASDLINLKGKKYDGKRNHINKFKKTYTSYEYRPISKDEIEDCKVILENWCKEHTCDENSDFSCEKRANNELLDNYDIMGVKGAIMYVDGKPEAFTVGELLNGNTAVIHIEKANSAINGLYTYINQQFCTNVWMDCEFINREQDLGLEGLRKAKLSYNPAKIITKYTITAK